MSSSISIWLMYLRTVSENSLSSEEESPPDSTQTCAHASPADGAMALLLGPQLSAEQNQRDPHQVKAMNFKEAEVRGGHIEFVLV
ncbi:hypothetical protein SLA2020_399480 [Shorea laevis]